MARESFVFPTSFAQERLWFLDQLEPDSAAYNRPVAFRLAGPLDVGLLERCLNEIVRRHGALRATFSAPEGRLVQVIASSLPLSLSVLDLSELAGSQREAEARRLAAEEARCPFDLAEGPLVRITLLRLGEEHHILLFVTHHIVFDAWSAKVLAQECKALYDAMAAGRAPALPELPIQYPEFARRQREGVGTEAFEAGRAYWRERLGGELPALDLPGDRPRPPERSMRGATESFVLPGSLSASLRDLGREEDATLFMTLLAAFKVLLYRYTGQEDIVVGVPVAGRNRVEVEDLIGLFTSPLALRTDLAGNPTFRELLRRVRRVALEAYGHREYPFTELLAELQPERDLSRTPIFQVMFNFENIPERPVAAGGLGIEELELDRGTALLDLTLEIIQKREGLSCSLAYSRDLFDAATIARLAGHYRVLLEGIVADPDRRLSALPILTQAERQQLLLEWNDTAADYPSDACVHELFEAQVERTPDAVAVVCGDRQLTYRELNARANQLAHCLRKRGVGREVLVGVFLERSPEMVVGVLGVLKAGGAYVPLDPRYPPARVAYMLKDSRARLLLTQEQRLQDLPRHDAEVLCLDQRHTLCEREDDANPESVNRPDDLAYVIYTSGSTGRPKGVLTPHRGVVNYLAFLAQAYRLSESDRVLQLAFLSFDASVRDVIGPLTAGARLVLVGDEDARDPAALLATIREHRVTCLLSVVPTLLHSLTEAARDEGGACDSIRLILSSAESLHVPTCRKARDAFAPRARLVNQYGPTECTMTTTYYAIADLDRQEGAVPIGRPIPNAQVYILDRHLNPAPVGVPGELHIGGVGLARGYLNRPELTADRFIPHPFRAEPEARLYKTGDRARYLPDGNIEFLGRFDHQVKVRGYRVELGEIEAVLREHPAVREAVVVVREETPGDKRLAAYVVPEPALPPQTAELHRFLRSRLPDYMVPSAFVVLDALPLTPNGKVDRGALPAPSGLRPELQEAFVAPCTGTERAVARIWSEVLGLEQVGVHDSFFELGGNSLLATQVVSRIRGALQVTLSLRSFFAAPTVAGMAQAVEEADRGEISEPAVVPIPRRAHAANALSRGPGGGLKDETKHG